MPFYRSLRAKLAPQASLIAVFPANQSTPQGFLAARAVRVDRVVSSDSLRIVGVVATPTLLLVDEHGEVKRAWVGAQPEAKHREVLESVFQD